MATEKRLRPGDKIMVMWGHKGEIEASVYRIGAEGQLYVRRWRKNYHNWTRPRRAFPIFQDGKTRYDLLDPATKGTTAT